MIALFVLLLASDAGPKRVAVLDFVPVEVEASVAVSFTQLVASELTKQGLEALSSRDVSSLVSLEERKLMIGAYDTKTGAQLGQLFSARYVVAGSLNKLGAELVVTAQLLDTQSGAVINRATLTVKSVDALAKSTTPLVRALLADSGRLQLYDQVPGARLYLDDELLGVMPLGIVPLKSEGRHRLHAESTEHAPWDQEIDVHRGQTTRLRVDLVALKTLEDRSRDRRAAAFVLLSGAVLTATTSALLFWGTFESKRQYEALDDLVTPQRTFDALAQRTLGLYAGAFVALGAAAGLVATSLYLLLVDPHRARLMEAEKALRFEPLLGPSGVGVSVSGRL